MLNHWLLELLINMYMEFLFISWLSATFRSEDHSQLIQEADAG